MFFIFSKITSFFITPSNWIIALLLWIFFVKSPVLKKRLTVVLILLILVLGNEVIYTNLALKWQAEPIKFAATDKYDAGIILGGLSSFDKSGKGFLNAASDRLVETFILYKSGTIKRIVLSGGSVRQHRPKEADFLYKKFIEMGVAPKDLVVENQSRTTFENATFTRKIADSLQLKPPFVLVTSALHVPRAKMVFEKAGLPVIAFPSDYHVLEKSFDFDDYLLPKIYIIDSWAGLIKEVVGVMGYKLFNKA